MPHRSGCGGLIITSAGQIKLMFSSNTGNSCVLSQELHPILAGLQACEILGERHMAINSDNKRAVMIDNR